MCVCVLKRVIIVCPVIAYSCLLEIMKYLIEGKWKRERERETDRETERETDRQKER